MYQDRQNSVQNKKNILLWSSVIEVDFLNDDGVTGINDLNYLNNDDYWVSCSDRQFRP